MAVMVVSYAREDQWLVRPMVALLQAAFPHISRAVFWDDFLEAGGPWYPQIKQHIDSSSQLFVFWCFHASASKEVAKEYRYALRRGKRVVPVLIDTTPLPHELAPIQGVDLRRAIQHPSGVESAGASLFSRHRSGSSDWASVLSDSDKHREVIAPGAIDWLFIPEAYRTHLIALQFAPFLAPKLLTG